MTPLQQININQLIIKIQKAKINLRSVYYIYRIIFIFE